MASDAWTEIIDGQNVTLDITLSDSPPATVTTKFKEPMIVVQAKITEGGGGPSGTYSVPVTDENGFDVLNTLGTSISADTTILNADLSNGVFTRGPLTITPDAGVDANTTQVVIYGEKRP